MVWLGCYFSARKRIGQEEDGRHHTYSQALTFTVTAKYEEFMEFCDILFKQFSSNKTLNRGRRGVRSGLRLSPIWAMTDEAVTSNSLPPRRFHLLDIYNRKPWGCLYEAWCLIPSSSSIKWNLTLILSRTIQGFGYALCDGPNLRLYV